MQKEGELVPGEDFPDCSEVETHDYIMIDTEQDREAAYRWRLANTIRRSKKGAKANMLEFLRQNVGRPVHGDELRYVAKGKSEWGRRVRELRTEDGWQVHTHWNGRPDLKPGVYVLESDRQLPAHDRRLPDSLRREVLLRDAYQCQDCGWTRQEWTPDAPRHLELHHIEHHAEGGKNAFANLVALCDVCHDAKHRYRGHSALRPEAP